VVVPTVSSSGVVYSQPFVGAVRLVCGLVFLAEVELNLMSEARHSAGQELELGPVLAVDCAVETEAVRCSDRSLSRFSQTALNAAVLFGL